MMSDVSPPATTRCPDHSTCRHCSQPITWDEYCYTHDSNGMADCGLAFLCGGSGATLVMTHGKAIMVNPEITQDERYLGKRAEPIEWNTPA